MAEEKLEERAAKMLAEREGLSWEHCHQDQWRADARAVLALVRAEQETQLLGMLGNVGDAVKAWWEGETNVS